MLGISNFYYHQGEKLSVFKGKRSISGIMIWRKIFQEKINEIAGNSYLQFRCETWNSGGCPYQSEANKFSMIIDKRLTFIDLDLFWNKNVIL